MPDILIAAIGLVVCVAFVLSVYESRRDSKKQERRIGDLEGTLQLLEATVKSLESFMTERDKEAMEKKRKGRTMYG